MGKSDGSKNIDVPNLDNKLIELIQKGRKLEALKLYIDKTGVDLTTGKNYIDMLAQSTELSIRHKKMTSDTQKNNKIGCLPFLIFGIIFLGILNEIIT